MSVESILSLVEKVMDSSFKLRQILNKVQPYKAS